MFALKEAEDRLRKTEYAKENLARDLERQTNKVQMIEKNQELVSSPPSSLCDTFDRCKTKSVTDLVCCSAKFSSDRTR